MLLPFLLTMSYSSGANGVDNLFCFSCFSNTLSLGTRSEYSACLFFSAYNLAFAFISPSLSCTSLGARSSRNSGKLVRIFLPNRSSAGLTRVVVLGVDLYAIKYLQTSSFHCLPSACAICILFKRDQFCLSISPLVWGHKGMVLLCSIPHSSKYLSNILETNCGPLSLVTDSGKT